MIDGLTKVWDFAEKAEEVDCREVYAKTLGVEEHQVVKDCYYIGEIWVIPPFRVVSV